MPHRRLGRSGLLVSAIGLGSRYGPMAEIPTDRTARLAIIHRAFTLGINLFDTADVYAAGDEERLLGEALRDLPRSEVVVASKCGLAMGAAANGRGLSRKHIVESCHGSLRRLGLDYLDLYQFHAPDPGTPLEESVAAIDLLQRQGLILYWGVSNYQELHYQELLDACRAVGVQPPVADQIKHNLLRRGAEERLLPLLRRSGAAVLAYSPLEQGFLTGKYRSPADAAAGNRLGQRGPEAAAAILSAHNLAAMDDLRPLAAQAGLTTTQLALAWILREPVVASALIGATRAEQLDDCVAASGVALAADLLDAIDRVLRLRLARIRMDDCTQELRACEASLQPTS